MCQKHSTHISSGSGYAISSHTCTHGRTMILRSESHCPGIPRSWVTQNPTNDRGIPNTCRIGVSDDAADCVLTATASSQPPLPPLLMVAAVVVLLRVLLVLVLLALLTPASLLPLPSWPPPLSSASVSLNNLG
jgi:hypothetical protein